MTDLQLLSEDDDTLAGHVRVAAAWSVLAKVAKDEYDRRRTGPVTDRVREAAELTGSDGFTGRIDGVGQVILTAPKPNPKVDDRDVFVGWLGEQDQGDLYAYRREAVLLDALGAVRHIEAGDWAELADFIEVRTEVLLSEDVFDTLVKRGVVKVTDSGVFDTESGAKVPGTSVSKAAQTVSVRVDKDARARVSDGLQAALGVSS